MKKSLPSNPWIYALSTSAISLATSQGANIVQITLSNNSINSTFNTDLTGDGVDDITITNTVDVADLNSFSLGNPALSPNPVKQALSTETLVPPSSSYRRAWTLGAGATGGLNNGTQLFTSAAVPPAQEVFGFAKISFTDLNINDGNQVFGFLELRGNFPEGFGVENISLTRLIFDTDDFNADNYNASDLNSTTTYSEYEGVPEPSALGLLALGAVGVLRRRRRVA